MCVSLHDIYGADWIQHKSGNDNAWHVDCCSDTAWSHSLWLTSALFSPRKRNNANFRFWKDRRHWQHDKIFSLEIPEYCVKLAEVGRSRSMRSSSLTTCTRCTRPQGLCQKIRLRHTRESWTVKCITRPNLQRIHLALQHLQLKQCSSLNLSAQLLPWRLNLGIIALLTSCTTRSMAARSGQYSPFRFTPGSKSCPSNLLSEGEKWAQPCKQRGLVCVWLLRLKANCACNEITKPSLELPPCQQAMPLWMSLFDAVDLWEVGSGGVGWGWGSTLTHNYGGLRRGGGGNPATQQLVSN